MFALSPPAALALRYVATFLPFLLVSAAPLAAQTEADYGALSGQVEIRRTSYGTPHIRAENLRAAGYGLGWVQMEDYGERVVHMILRNRGELGMHFGRDSIASDFRNRPTWLRAVEMFPLLDSETRDVYEGFAAAMNRFVSMHPERFPATVRPTFAGPDVLTTDIEAPSERALRRVLQKLNVKSDAPTSGGAEGERWGDPLELEGEPHPDEGSNSWALAPSRTKSGRAILLRNPHLRWSAGYYEAQVTVPGVVNFYGDFRIGGPFQTIGGFNDRLGWSTTNNAPDPDEVYALTADPTRPDHVLFDGASVPLRRETITIAYTIGTATGTETRELWHSHLGPVVHRAGDRVYVWKAAGAGDWRLGQQWLRMMRSGSLQEWKQAMRMLAKPSSNFTYADADGNIFYVWYGMTPLLPHAPGGDSIAIAASRSAEVWTRLVPFDSLPQLQNPNGGYIHQENDPFHYTNLTEVLLPGRFPANFGEPYLGLRSQHALQLIAGRDKLSLEDVVRLKHSMRMLLADRVKPDLIAAARSGTRTARVDSAVAVLEAWDNTVAEESRGGVLFDAFWDRYTQTTAAPAGASREAGLYRQPWSAAAPTSTPTGLADAARAVEALAWAADEVVRRYGALDVAWGTVHRVRHGDVDAPVGGCSGTLGCFRVLWFEEQPDGKRAVQGGDGWVLAVEFTSPPRAYSVLAYGITNRPTSPHHDDQAAMFARNEMKRVFFTQKDVAANTLRRYRPGM